MEGEETVLDTDDVEMLDVEEGELTEHFMKTELLENSDAGIDQVNQEPDRSNNLRRKRKRKKNNRKRSSCSNSADPNVTQINRFVLDVCKRLREKKSYLVYTAAGCLGVSALSDLVKEVYAIQTCGGQKTADGRRSRTGGGILWNIIKSRDPNAYKEIMRKGKEFEKQFKHPFRGNQETVQPTDGSSEKTSLEINQVTCGPSHDEREEMEEKPSAEQKRTSVHSRIRLPVIYEDDLLGEEDANDKPTTNLA